MVRRDFGQEGFWSGGILAGGILVSNLSFFFLLPQNNPEMDVFWSPLSFETSLKRFRCPSKKCSQFFFFLSWLSRQHHAMFFSFGQGQSRAESKQISRHLVDTNGSKGALFLCLALLPCSAHENHNKTTDGAQCNYTLS